MRELREPPARVSRTAATGNDGELESVDEFFFFFFFVVVVFVWKGERRHRDGVEDFEDGKNGKTPCFGKRRRSSDAAAVVAVVGASSRNSFG